MDSTVIIVLAIVLLALIILNNIKLLPPSQPVGGCAGTQYGCCPDNITSKNAGGSNCSPPIPPTVIGGCAGTRYGCCPNNATSKIDQQGSNCVLK